MQEKKAHDPNFSLSPKKLKHTIKQTLSKDVIRFSLVQYRFGDFGSLEPLMIPAVIT